MAIRKFQRGQSTYACRCCKKITRNVGGDEIQVELCLDCFNLAGIENELMDSDPDDGGLSEHSVAEAKSIFAKRPELKPLFERLSRAVE